MGKGLLIIVAAAIIGGGILLAQSAQMAAHGDNKQSEYEVELIARDLARSGMSFAASELHRNREETGAVIEAAINDLYSDPISYRGGTYHVTAEDLGSRRMKVTSTGEAQWKSQTIRHELTFYYMPALSVTSMFSALGMLDEPKFTANSFLIDGTDTDASRGAHIPGLGVFPGDYETIMTPTQNKPGQIQGLMPNGELSGSAGESIVEVDPLTSVRQATYIYEQALALLSGMTLPATVESIAPPTGVTSVPIASGAPCPSIPGKTYEVRYEPEVPGHIEVEGCGLLILGGDVDVAAGQGSLEWQGLVMITKPASSDSDPLSVSMHGQVNVDGAFIMLASEEDGAGSVTDGSIDLEIPGNAQIRLDVDAVRKATDLLSMDDSHYGWRVVGSDERTEVVNS